MVNVTMSVEEYLRLLEVVNRDSNPSATDQMIRAPTPVEITKAKRKVSPYNRKYRAAFKKVAPRYKLKSGKWKKNGFKTAVKAAHKMAGGKK